MYKSIFSFLFFSGLILSLQIFLVSIAHAEPTLSVKLLSKGTELAFSLSPTEDSVNCTYALFGSQRRKQVAKALPADSTLLIDEQLIPNNGTSFLVDELSRLRQKRGKKKQNIFFRAQETCGDATSFSRVIKRAFKTLKKKKKSITISRLFFLLREGLPFSHLTLEDAFPNISLIQTTDIRHANDGSDRIFVLQQTGKISVFPNSNSATASTFLDLSDKVQTGGERGLLSLAFHPSFTSNRFIYVHYIAKATEESPSGDTIISRFTVREDNPNEVDPDSELIIFTTFQPRTNHNGGSILFGSDGYLYTTLGDGGSQNDPNGNSQNRATILGNILRIDVDTPSGDDNYSIPSDNPFVGNSDGFFEEIYAYGLRNPWRASFDRATDELWVGDVGQALFEEVNIITKGANLGWKIMEGFSCFEEENCDQSNLTLPIYDYDREDGASVTGGYVYRGSSVQALFGKYLFSDFNSGKVWSLLRENNAVTVDELFDTEFFVSTFGEDEAGEVYLADYGTGKIYRFSYRAPL